MRLYRLYYNPRGRGSPEGYKELPGWCKGGKEKEGCKAEESLWAEKG